MYIDTNADLMMRLLRRLVINDEPTPTPSTLGKKALEIVIDRGRDSELQSLEEQPAVLTGEEMAKALAFSKENELVRYLTPFLIDILEKDGMVLINGENFSWLHTGYAAQKPDMFLCPRWCYEKRTPSGADAVTAGFRFGIVSDRRVYDTVHLLDAKLSCSDSALGELIIHCQYLSHAIGPGTVVRGMLFDREKFWLIECQGLELIFRKVGFWVLPGSRAHIFGHFYKLKWHALEEVCRGLGAVVVDPQSSEHSTALLGIGGFGRVVRVTKDGASMALKVSDASNHKRLSIEHDKLLTHGNNCGCACVVRAMSEVVSVGGLCGFLLAPIGQRCVSREMVLKSELPVLSVLTSLLQLHEHKPPIIHGDPRLANLIIGADAKGLFWIDLTDSCTIECLSDVRILQGVDLRTLLESMIPQKSEMLLFDEDIKEYINNGPSEAIISAIAVKFTREFLNLP